ncbi:hypothetical protein L6452_39061 [Arctium lappa]|uniref:Uncharacterized protein n=1 Tax=Arctium lappa TaxID=4217 RepID=A0ACB8XRP8_ARCLA|nr:hypothetical protein L6452_39061 [Arctium lappa]
MKSSGENYNSYLLIRMHVGCKSGRKLNEVTKVDNNKSSVPPSDPNGARAPLALLRHTYETRDYGRALIGSPLKSPNSLDLKPYVVGYLSCTLGRLLCCPRLLTCEILLVSDIRSIIVFTATPLTCSLSSTHFLPSFNKNSAFSIRCMSSNDAQTNSKTPTPMATLPPPAPKIDNKFSGRIGVRWSSTEEDQRKVGDDRVCIGDGGGPQ